MCMYITCTEYILAVIIWNIKISYSFIIKVILEEPYKYISIVCHVAKVIDYLLSVVLKISSQTWTIN